MDNLETVGTYAAEGAKIEGQLHQLRADAMAEHRERQEKLAEIRREVEELAADAGAQPSLDPVRCAVQRVVSIAKRGASDLMRLTSLWSGALTSLIVFKLQHGISRPPQVPNQAEKPTAVALMIVAEGLATSLFFYGSGMTPGFIGAFGAGLLISTTSVVGCLCGGFFLGRYWSYGRASPGRLNRRFAAARRTRRLLTIPFALAAAYLHTTVGLVRAQESFDHLDHSLAAYAAIFGDFHAGLLILVGVAMSAIAWWKGLGAFDDPYPGYGALYRAAMKGVADDARAVFDACGEEIERECGGALDELKSATSRTAKIAARYRKAMTRYLSAAGSLQSDVLWREQQLKADIAQSIDLHRGTRQVRSVHPDDVPAGLTDLSGLISSWRPAWPAWLGTFESEVADLRKEIANARERALEILSSAFAEFCESGKPKGGVRE